jgi:hypothetical protein
MAQNEQAVSVFDPMSILEAVHHKPAKIKAQCKSVSWHLLRLEKPLGNTTLAAWRELNAH